MLGVLTPFMLKNDFYTKEYVALLSSVYMIAYAAGQLFNGVLGDIFKPRIMVLLGLLIAGAVNISFPLLQTREIQLFLFFILGYVLVCYFI
jgi:sugar phosphate permease